MRYQLEYLVEHLGEHYYAKDSFEGTPDEAFTRAKEIAEMTQKEVRITNRPLGVDQLIAPEK